MRHYSSVRTEYFMVEGTCYTFIDGQVEFDVTLCYVEPLLKTEGSIWYGVCGNI